MLKTVKDTSALEIARALWEVICILGPPAILQSDRGTEFINQVIAALTNMMGIDHRVITAYNPKADGKVERTIQTVRNTVKKCMKGASVYWPQFVAFTQLAYNNKVSSLTGATPFMLMFNRVMNEFTDYTKSDVTKPNIQDEKTWREYQDRVTSLIYPSIVYRTQQRQQAYIDKMKTIRERVLKENIPPGTLVMIKDDTYIKNPHTRPKLEPKYVGPYMVKRRTEHGAYVVFDEVGDVHHRLVPADQMKIVRKPRLYDCDQKKSDTDDTYVVDHIVDHSFEDGVMWYGVRWKGWGPEHDSWVTEDMINDESLIQSYFNITRREMMQQLAKGNSAENDELAQQKLDRPASIDQASSSSSSSSKQPPQSTKTRNGRRRRKRSTINNVIFLHNDVYSDDD
jgi:hypothetical protein